MTRFIPLGAVGLVLVAAGCGSYDGKRDTVPKDDRPAVRAEVPPPPVSGGTLAVSETGTLAVAADSDRDRVVIADLTSASVSGIVDLNRGDEPGRVVTAGESRAYVALRRGGAVAVIDLEEPRLLERLQLCSDPRGLALDESAGLLHVACAGGDLISISTEDGSLIRRVNLGPDLRDVVVVEDGLMVSRFRSAEILRLDARGNVVGSTFPTNAMHTVLRDVEDGDFGEREGVEQLLSPSVAWRMVSNGQGGVVVLHQRGTLAAIELPQSRGDGGSPYGSGPLGCSSIVQSAVTEVTADGEQRTTRPLAAVALGVDLAVSPSNGNLLIANAGLLDPGVPKPLDADGSPLIEDRVAGALNLIDRVALQPVVAVPDFQHDCAGGMAASPTEQPVVSVAVAPGNLIVAQTRQPSQLILVSGSPEGSPSVIDLGGASVFDTGHELFHRDAGSGIACASCHPEGREDGRVWEFANVGKRRTQPLDAGLAGTQPFHWSGDLPGLSNLVDEVFVKRMGGAQQSDGRLAALQRWLFALEPLEPLRSADDPGVMHGRELFESAGTECGTCHGGGHEGSFQVREASEAFQVPSLVGIGHRAPFMHDGCAATLEARFDPACGGELHGRTSQLSKTELTDLVSYLQSL